MFSDGINVKGNVHIEIYDTESGKLKEEFYHKNLVVDVGKKFIASRLAAPPQLVGSSTVALNTQWYYRGYLYTVTTAGTVAAVPSLTQILTGSTTSNTAILRCDCDLTTGGVAISHMGIGSGAITPVSSDTALLTPVGARIATALSYTTNTNTVIMSSTFPGSTYANPAISEAGIFTALTGGTMVCRTTFGSFAIASTDTVAITWNLSIL